MKRSANVFCFVIIYFIIKISFVSSGVGISPASYDDYFEPNFNKIYTFYATAFSNDSSFFVSLDGDMVEYAKLSSDYFLSWGTFNVELNLPEKIDKPGMNNLYIKVTEYKDDDKEATIGARGAVQAPIRIFVPYPGKYTEGYFNVKDANEGENVNYSLIIRNLGTEDLTMAPKIKFYEAGSFDKLVYEVEFNKTKIASKESFNFKGLANSSFFVSGDYDAYAEVDYGETKFFNDSFSVGEFFVEIKDYDYLFLSNKINPMNIIVKSYWNLDIKNVYSEVFVTDNGRVVAYFKTPTEALGPWETKNITAFFDASNLTAGRYLANINLHYFDGKNIGNKDKLVAIYVRDVLVEKSYTKEIIYGSIALIVILLAVLIYLEIRLKKLSNFIRERYEKKK